MELLVENGNETVFSSTYRFTKKMLTEKVGIAVTNISRR